MKKFEFLTLLMLVVTTLNAQKILIYSEEFIQYDNRWKQANNDSCILNSTDGKYKISSKKCNGQTIYSTQWRKIDQNMDFSIETAIIHTGGKDNQYFGITYGFEDYNNNFTFCISADGNYQVMKKDKGKTFKLKQSTFSSFINTGNSEYNKLKIDKSGNTYTFFINDSLLFQLPFDTFYGQQIGFIISDSQSMEVDYVNIYQVPSNQVKGIEIPINMVRILNDDFNDDSNNWGKANCSSGSFKIEQGKAILKCSAIGHCCNVFIESGINSQNDFIIEAEIKKTNGYGGSSFGIIWGSEIFEDHQEMMIQSDGEFGFYENYSGSSDYTPEVNIYNAPNVLTIYKLNTIVNYYINGKFVYSTSFLSNMYESIGFVACDPVTFEIDNLQIWVVKP